MEMGQHLEVRAAKGTLKHFVKYYLILLLIFRGSRSKGIFLAYVKQQTRWMSFNITWSRAHTHTDAHTHTIDLHKTGVLEMCNEYLVIDRTLAPKRSEEIMLMDYFPQKHGCSGFPLENFSW